MLWKARKGVDGAWWLACGDVNVARFNTMLRPPGTDTTADGPEQWAKEVARLVNRGIGTTSPAIAEMQKTTPWISAAQEAIPRQRVIVTTDPPPFGVGGLPSNWTEPKHPGDRVRNVALKRGDELGDVTIQWYEASVRVGAFLPGVTQCPPGDTPKTEPEFSCWHSIENKDAANRSFDVYLIAAFQDGWTIYDRNAGASNG